MKSDRFTFRLERLLSLRQKAEEAAAIALAEARNAETAAHEAKAALAMHRVRTQESLTLRAGDSSTVASLRQVAMLVEDADRRIAHADERYKEIADLNPKVKLPDLPIIKIRRADGSGTTWNFTRFLSEANADWKKTYGFGQQVEWVGGAIGAKGNDGVANNVMQTNGSIGYVEYAFAKSNNLATAKMIGTDGKAVAPDLKSFQSTWPMVATSYIVMPKASADPAAAKIALDFFAYGYAHDADAEALDYMPLTAAQKSESKKAWSQVSTK